MVRERRRVADDVVELTLAASEGDVLPDWEPGAHIGLNLANGLARQYSLCGEVGEPEWKISVLRETAGRGGSAFMHDKLNVGDIVEVTGPTNHFELVESESYVFVAGGIGITPILPMIQEAERRRAAWVLYYGGRTRSSMAYAAELESLYPDRVHVLPEEDHGLLPLKTVLGEAGASPVYSCGPEGLISTLEARVAEFPGPSLHFERFTPIEVDTSHDSEFEVVLERRGVTLGVGAHESILEAVEREGVRILSSCREGTCGTCETAIVDGAVDHRDAVLTAEEKEANEVLMICVSRAVCPRLVLDL